MSPRSLPLLLVAAIVLAAGAAFLLLRNGEVDLGLEEGDGVAADRLGSDPGAPPPVVTSSPAPSRPGVVELDVDGAPRVSVLPVGGTLPPRGDAHEDPMVPLHDATVRGNPRTLSGTQLLYQVGDAVYVRFRSQADLDAVRALEPDPDWPADEPLPLAEVVEYWRRQGFEVEPLEHVLLVQRASD